MKKIWLRLCATLLALTMIPCAALAEMSTSLLMSQPGARMWMLNANDMAIRTVRMPFRGTPDQPDWEADLYIDYVQLGLEGVTAMRVTVSTVGDQELLAQEVAITVSGKTWTFVPSRDVSEYDLVYYEDFYACLDYDGLELIQQLAKAGGSCTVRLQGDATLTATIEVPAADVKALLELYSEAGGRDQDLSAVSKRWPMTVSK